MVKAKTIAEHVPACQLAKKVSADSKLLVTTPCVKAGNCLFYSSERANTRAHPNQYCGASDDLRLQRAPAIDLGDRRQQPDGDL